MQHSDTAHVSVRQDAAVYPAFGARSWGWLIVRGLLGIALGLTAFFFPFGALVAFATLFAAFVFTDGIFSLVAGLRRRGPAGSRWWALILRGLLGIAIGMLFIATPFFTTISYALATLVLLAAWAIAGGVAEIAAAIRLRREITGEWLLGVAGVLSILLGLSIPLLLAFYPAATILSVAWVIGFYALLSGIVLLLQGLRLRRART